MSHLGYTVFLSEEAGKITSSPTLQEPIQEAQVSPDKQDLFIMKPGHLVKGKQEQCILSPTLEFLH
jgi:hypothetical protein